MQFILAISQIVIALALIVTILLQQRGAGGSAIFGGGGGGGSSYYTKRGFEKIIFIATIVLAGLFIVAAFINLVL
jgi:protein translocase SecG subunit